MPLSLSEELKGRPNEPRLIETGLITTATDSVNLMEVSGADWELLRSIQQSESTQVTLAVEWLKECGLVIIEEGRVTLTQFALSWLSA